MVAHYGLMFKENIVSYISRFTDVTLSRIFTCYVRNYSEHYYGSVYGISVFSPSPTELATTSWQSISHKKTSDGKIGKKLVSMLNMFIYV